MSTQTKWALDPTHSEVGFKIKHLMITNVSGSFGSFTADAITDGDDFNTAQINFSADISSINTGNEQRDTHLKSPDFFEAEKFAHLTFKGNGLTATDDAGEYELKGDLTIRDVTKPIKLKVEMGGIAKDPWGQTKAGFTIAGKINRKDFGLVWNAPTEAGGLLVSEEVRLNAEIQLVKQA
jgi:polyisoprenoid-binding protein YceI